MNRLFTTTRIGVQNVTGTTTPGKMLMLPVRNVVTRKQQTVVLIGNQMNKYNTILVDPPWPSKTIGTMKGHRMLNGSQYPAGVVYPVMSMQQILGLSVEKFATADAHLWLWTTNRFLHEAFHCIEAWGFNYLYDFIAVKPSGCGAYMAVTTQHLLLSYHKKCVFNKKKWLPTNFKYVPTRHSAKPMESYEIIESVSSGPMLELFARNRRVGWDVWGNEVISDIQM